MDGILLTRDQLECWAGMPLTDDMLTVLEDCIPNSSIPDAINAIVTAVNDDDERTAAATTNTK